MKTEKRREHLKTLNLTSSSRVRDHLANERTYLAWMRTAISLMGFGVVIVRLRFFRPPITTSPGNTWKLGTIFAIVGLLTVLFSSYHYFAVCRDIDNSSYEPPIRRVLVFSIIMMLLGAGIIYYVFTLPLNPINTLTFE
ncbi:DUF202 domain-containing protein [Myxosarcina sp. GI1]|uniref:YidH family protein n=1 Tax=Myxosarcina sp. GI1 TaxID=1541065 RepID=UPI00068B8C15